MSAVNVEHLRKQAKKLVRLYPDVISEHPATISLSAAQSVIAKLNGFPNWEALVRRHGAATGGAQKKRLPTEIRLSDHLILAVDEDKRRLPAAYSDETGSPTRFRMGYDAILRYRHPHEATLARNEDDVLDELFERAFSGFIDASYSNLDRPTRLVLLHASEASLKRCPYCIETAARIAGLMHAEGSHGLALQMLEHYARQLLEMIPKDRYVHVDYGFLDNRPFHRLMHAYVLLLHEVGRNDDARKIAESMVALHPNDNIGFRFLIEGQNKE